MTKQKQIGKNEQKGKGFVMLPANTSETLQATDVHLTQEYYVTLRVWEEEREGGREEEEEGKGKQEGREEREEEEDGGDGWD